MKSKKLVGAHVSASGGVFNAPLNAKAIGANAFALFLKNQKQWNAKDYDDKVCFGSSCVSKEEFVKDYISEALYPDAMNDILSQKPLKIDSNITRSDAGFTQEATSSSYQLTYMVDNKEIYLFERKGGFKLHLRFLD